MLGNRRISRTGSDLFIKELTAHKLSLYPKFHHLGKKPHSRYVKYFPHWEHQPFSNQIYSDTGIRCSMFDCVTTVVPNKVDPQMATTFLDGVCGSEFWVKYNGNS